MKKLSLLLVLLMSVLLTNCETTSVNDETGIEPTEQQAGNEKSLEDELDREEDE